MIAFPFILSLLLITAASAQFRTWTNADGKSAELKLVRVTGTDGKKVGEFVMRNGRTVNIPASALGSADAQQLDQSKPEIPGQAKKGRPRIFMSMHGSHKLASDDLDSQWAYVRENLDGIHDYTTYIDIVSQKKIWEKVKARSVVGDALKRDRIPGKATSASPGSKVEREAHIIYTGNPNSLWEQQDLSEALSAIVAGPGDGQDSRYKEMWFGTTPKAYAKGLSKEALAACDASGALLLDFSQSKDDRQDLETMVKAMKDARARGQKFVWSASPGKGEPWLGWFQKTYNKLNSAVGWTERDAIILINHMAAYRMVPEADEKGEPQDTFTGVLYWALRQ